MHILDDSVSFEKCHWHVTKSRFFPHKIYLSENGALANCSCRKPITERSVFMKHDKLFGLNAVDIAFGVIGSSVSVIILYLFTSV